MTQPLTADKLLELEDDATPGPWEVKHERSCQIDETWMGVFSGKQNLFDNCNSDVMIIHTEHDDEGRGRYHWDETARRNFELVTALRNNAPRLIKALAILEAIEELRQEDGSSLQICCPNADFNAGPNEVVDCCGDWTNWEGQRFTGETLEEALQVAVSAYRSTKAAEGAE